ncbi:MAG: TonB family protein [Deltaproteobacteria bacterium]|nr:TonB family protein [Deltaproteobacteria bacterium]
MARPLYEEPFVLATAGTLAIHLLIAVAGDAIVVTHPYVPEQDPPHVELVDIQVPTPPPPPPPAPVLPEAQVEPPVAPKVIHTKAIAQPPPVASETPPPKTDTPPPSTEPGGGPVVAMDSLGPDATGHVPVAVGKMPQGRIGRGGSGAGTGAGSGSGTGDAPAPMSVATIKTRALPRGDYGYIDASRDYPTEAKQLGIEGPVRVRLIVDDLGKVTRATLLPPGLGHGLDELALRKAKEIQFEPARDTEDHPVTSVVVWTFNMTLPK